MKIIQQRRESAPDWMFGAVTIDGQAFCLTLEDELREEKLPGETAIPAGVYHVVVQDSRKFGPNTVTLLDVPGFTHVRVHSVRDADDTEGCIGVGDSANYETGTLSGGLARGIQSKLQRTVAAAISSGEAVTWEIKNAPGARYVDTGHLVSSETRTA